MTNTTDKGWESRFEEECPLVWGARDWAKDFIRREIQQKGEEEYSRGYQDGFRQGRFDTTMDSKEEYERGKAETIRDYYGGQTAHEYLGEQVHIFIPARIKEVHLEQNGKKYQFTLEAALETPSSETQV